MTTAQPAPVHGALFDLGTVHTDPQTGYRGPTVCQIAHITHLQLGYWTRSNLVQARTSEAAGSGSRRLDSFREIGPAVRTGDSYGVMPLTRLC